MRSLKVFLDDELIATDTDQDVANLRDLLDAYLRIKAKKPALIHVREIGENQTNGTYRDSPPETNRTLPPRNKPGRLTDPLAYHKEAMRILGRKRTGEDIYQRMIELGFKSKAKDPKEAVKAQLRYYTDTFLKDGVDENGMAVWSLVESIQTEEAFAEISSGDDLTLSEKSVAGE